jgi:hypothetical protein
MEASMPAQNGSQARSQTGSKVGWTIRLLGLCVFAVGFFLPAVRAGGPGSEAVVFPGWKCASVALTETVALVGKSGVEKPSFEVLLVIFSGWINPLVLLLFVLSLWPALLLLRRVLAVIVLLCMAATWTFFAVHKVTPLAGHFFWIAGALLVAAAAVTGGRPKIAARP